MARTKPESPPRRADPGLSWCRHCHGVVIPSTTGVLWSPMGAEHNCTTTREHLAAIGAAWVLQPDGSKQWTWLELTTDSPADRPHDKAA